MFSLLVSDVTFLPPVLSCDADPAALSKYIVALLRKDKPRSSLRSLCVDQLEVFLAKGMPLLCFLKVLSTILLLFLLLLFCNPTLISCPLPLDTPEFVEQLFHSLDSESYLAPIRYGSTTSPPATSQQTTRSSGGGESSPTGHGFDRRQSEDTRHKEVCLFVSLLLLTQ